MQEDKLKTKLARKILSLSDSVLLGRLAGRLSQSHESDIVYHSSSGSSLTLAEYNEMSAMVERLSKSVWLLFLLCCLGCSNNDQISSSSCLVEDEREKVHLWAPLRPKAMGSDRIAARNGYDAAFIYNSKNGKIKSLNWTKMDLSKIPESFYKESNDGGFGVFWDDLICDESAGNCFSLVRNLTRVDNHDTLDLQYNLYDYDKYLIEFRKNGMVSNFWKINVNDDIGSISTGLVLTKKNELLVRCKKFDKAIGQYYRLQLANKGQLNLSGEDFYTEADYIYIEKDRQYFVKGRYIIFQNDTIYTLNSDQQIQDISFQKRKWNFIIGEKSKKDPSYYAITLKSKDEKDSNVEQSYVLTTERGHSSQAIFVQDKILFPIFDGTCYSWVTLPLNKVSEYRPFLPKEETDIFADFNINDLYVIFDPVMCKNYRGSVQYSLNRFKENLGGEFTIVLPGLSSNAINKIFQTQLDTSGFDISVINNYNSFYALRNKQKDARMVDVFKYQGEGKFKDPQH